MKFRNALLTAGFLVTPLVAQAQAVNGPYISLGLGVNMMQDQHLKSITVGGVAVPGAHTDLGSRVGPAAVAAIGWGFGNGLRAELEGNYRYNAFNSSSTPGLHVGGNEQKYGGMFNVLYDFVGLTPYFQPYVGIGAGYLAVKEQDLHASTAGFAVTSGAQTKGSFAYQGILGAAFPMTAMPGLALTAEYRFMGLVGDRTYGATATAGAAAAPASLKLDHNYNHTFLLGVRYNFGQAPAPVPVAAPAPAPAPAVQPARSYLVFFDWDKATLTDRARQIIKEAADNSTHLQYTRLEVNGYTDTSGSPQYNQRLSVRRAEAVAAELVRNGVPRNAISIQGFGETHLLVPTGPNVREPQNRRVEIIIR
jgi:outer membrane protein OmpA-like peptidoglycan-associated protein